MLAETISGDEVRERHRMGAGPLLAAAGYLTDIVPTGSYHHSWRVALIARHLAATLCPAISRDVFYAGLLHEIGAVGAYKHVTRYSSLREQVDDPNIRNHPQRGAALLAWLPGMAEASAYVKFHHEWWDGRGYPDHATCEAIPLGARIVSIVSGADSAGCFRSSSSIRECLPLMSVLAGVAWPKDLWASFVRSTQDAHFYKSVTDPELLPQMMSDALAEEPVPDELQSDEGLERTLHLISVLVDLKDPSTSGHSMRTARRAQQLATYMKMSDDVARTAYRAGLVHDCGRLGVDTYILNKSGRLSDREMSAVREHAMMTLRILSCLPDCPQMASLGYVASHDHERFDGGGYPDGLAGGDIPVVSRILSVVDAFDSMISSANYRLLTPKGAVVRIEQSAGSQFDPDVARGMVEAVANGLFDEKTEQSAA